MTASSLVTRLDELGVKLSVDRDRLKWDAPTGVMTPEIKAAMAIHKHALMARLASFKSRSSSPAIPDVWPPRPIELATWPIARRKLWGELANAIEDDGMPFPKCEIEAFRQLASNTGSDGDSEMFDSAR